jgi:hypothetical protein
LTNLVLLDTFPVSAELDEDPSGVGAKALKEDTR